MQESCFFTGKILTGLLEDAFSTPTVLCFTLGRIKKRAYQLAVQEDKLLFGGQIRQHPLALPLGEPRGASGDQRPAKQQFTVPLREAGYYLDFPPETEEIRKRTEFLFLKMPGGKYVRNSKLPPESRQCPHDIHARLPGSYFFCPSFFLPSPSGKIILNTKKNTTMEMVPMRTVEPMLYSQDIIVPCCLHGISLIGEGIGKNGVFIDTHAVGLLPQIA